MTDLAHGYKALVEDAAVVETRSGDWLRLTGEDRLRFANALVTCDLRSLERGEGAYGFFTDPKGRVLADGAFLAGASELWLELPAGTGASIAAHMAKFRVADRVEIEELDGWRTVFVAGPHASEQLRAANVESVPGGAWAGTIEGGDSSSPFVVRGDRRLGVSALALAGEVGALEPVLERLRGAGVPSAPAGAVDAARIERGVAWCAPDFGPGSERGGAFPQETGLEEWAVSFEKGCYLGQEVVARIHFRGKVNRGLRGLVFEPGPRVETPCRLLSNGETVGVANSVADSPLLGERIGLAIVHHKAEVGSVLATDRNVGCRLVDLPFTTGR